MIYQSNVSASALIFSVSDDVTVYPAIKTRYYIDWYNDIVQSIYKSVIKPYTAIQLPAASEINISDITLPDGATFPEGIEMYIINNDKRYKLLKVDREQDLVFRNSAYIGSGKIKIKSDVVHDTAELVIELLVTPPVITENTASNTVVPFPVEYHDMIKARLKGEALKMCNQDGSAAKWLNDFNAALEDFKVFHFRSKSLI